MWLSTLAHIASGAVHQFQVVDIELKKYSFFIRQKLTVNINVSIEASK
jgi:hypothetical protein